MTRYVLASPIEQRELNANSDPISFVTNDPGVYAAGDIVRGASLVVWAIREGRDAADAMHAYVQSQAKVAAE